jgi:phospholipid transport system transporter-binding protein
MKKGIRQTSPGHYALEGPLNLASVTALRSEGRRQFAAGESRLTVDLATVTAADSAGLALLVDWLAWALSHQCEMRFENLPATLQSLARICEVTPLLEA